MISTTTTTTTTMIKNCRTTWTYQTIDTLWYFHFIYQIMTINFIDYNYTLVLPVVDYLRSFLSCILFIACCVSIHPSIYPSIHPSINPSILFRFEDDFK